MVYFAGIDIGSLTTEAVILNQKEEMVSSAFNLTGTDCNEAAEKTFGKALSRAGISKNRLSFIVATGYGRINIPFVDKKITEISCHGIGSHHLFPDAGTVIDIGGQDSKVIKIDNQGNVLDFTMNDKCAAGTGRFLEVMAGAFGLSLEDFASLSLKSKREISISSVCTVFAESEVISLIAQNQAKEDIIRGLHRAVVNRVWNMVQIVGVHGEVTMTGGVAKNRGVVALLEEKLGKKIHIHSEPQIVGALGAALLASRHFPQK